jgi:hypothetical protein
MSTQTPSPLRPVIVHALVCVAAIAATVFTTHVLA